MIFAIDFDGTLCDFDYPNIGKPNNRLINMLKHIKRKEHKLILWTCRTGIQLTEAVNWCKKYELEFDAINDDLEEVKKIYKDSGRKIFADYYIDDKNILINDFILLEQLL